jgi:hypothetical protein
MEGNDSLSNFGSPIATPCDRDDSLRSRRRIACVRDVAIRRAEPSRTTFAIADPKLDRCVSRHLSSAPVIPLIYLPNVTYKGDEPSKKIFILFTWILTPTDLAQFSTQMVGPFCPICTLFPYFSLQLSTMI